MTRGGFIVVCWILWMMVVLCVAHTTVVVHGLDSTEDAGPTPVHAADEVDTTWTPATATPVQPPCAEATQTKLTTFSLVNMALQRRCQEQSGDVNAFPFDVAPSREQLVRLSASAACRMVSKGVLRVVERECILGDFKMPIRATAETILKLDQDRKESSRLPIPSEQVLQQQITQRARMNHARDVDPIAFSLAQYPEEMHQYETQLTKAYASGGIILLSNDFKILNDLSGTEEQVDSEAAAAAAVAQLVDPSDLPDSYQGSDTGSPESIESHGSADESTESDQDVDVAAASTSHGSLRNEPSQAGSATGSLTDAMIPPASTAARASAATTTLTVSALVCSVLLVGV